MDCRLDQSTAPFQIDLTTHLAFGATHPKSNAFCLKFEHKRHLGRQDLRILYLLGCNEGPSKRYRVFNHIEALKTAGHHAEWIWDIHPQTRDRDFIASFSIVVNFRGGFNDRSAPFFDLVKSLGIPLVYDTDDLVFDPSVVDQIDAYRRMAPPDQVDYLSGMRSMSRALISAQYTTTSTSYLADYLEKYSRLKSWVIPFGVNDRQITLAGTSERPEGGLARS